MDGWGAVSKGDQPMGCICITGMHRTGTSLVAGLLHRHGLWLGDEADIMQANPFNPDGYFENDRLVEIDDAILALFGGSWSSPPEFPDAWTEDPRLAGILEDARAKGQRLAASGRRWGFKDPRAALTLPFWLSALGELTVIVTLRNPLETAQSLNRRDHMPLQQGMALWSAHYRSLLAHTTPATRIVVEYEAFCADPVGAARSLLFGLPGLRSVDADAARASVNMPLRHFRATLTSLEAQGAPSDVLELYDQLRSEAIKPAAHPEEGTAGVGEQLLEALRTIPAALSGLDLAIRDVHVDLQRLAAVVARLETEIGFVRSNDLVGIAAQVEYERGKVERIADALPTLLEPIPAPEAPIDISANGRRD